MNRHILPALLLVVLTVMVFGQVRGFEFINYDDTDYVTRNEMVRQGLTGKSVRWAITATVSATWQPLTWLSFMADVRGGEPDASVFHTTNLVLHVLNVLLLYFLLASLTREIWPAALVAALFAVHPLHVESVAWVAERKDVLSTFWGLVCLLAWAQWTRRGGALWYGGALAALALGLMAKPMLVTWPFVMLLLDYWPLARWGTVSRGDLVKEKLPFFGLAAISSVIAYGVQAKVGAVASGEVLALGPRVVNAIYSYAAYLIQTFWPQGFSILYPHPFLPGGVPLTAMNAALAIGVLVVATVILGNRRWGRFATMGWLFYLGTLLPVIGLVQIGVHARADRFTYVPLIGIFICVAWLLRLVWVTLEKRGMIRHVVPVLAVFAIGACAFIAHGQAALWRDQITLYEASLANPPGAPRIHYNLALAYSQAGDHRQALPHYRETLTRDPSHAKAWNNLGRTLNLMGQDEASERAFQEALKRQVPFPLARVNYAVLLDRTGRRAEAIEQRLLALQDDPENAANHNAVGSLLAMEGRVEDAVSHFRRAVQLDPANREYRANLQRATEMLKGVEGS